MLLQNGQVNKATHPHLKRRASRSLMDLTVAQFLVCTNWSTGNLMWEKIWLYGRTNMHNMHNKRVKLGRSKWFLFQEEIRPRHLSDLFRDFQDSILYRIDLSKTRDRRQNKADYKTCAPWFHKRRESWSNTATAKPKDSTPTPTMRPTPFLIYYISSTLLLCWVLVLEEISRLWH